MIETRKLYLICTSRIDTNKLNDIISEDQRIVLDTEYGFHFKQFRLTEEELLMIAIILPECIPMLMKE